MFQVDDCFGANPAFHYLEINACIAENGEYRLCVADAFLCDFEKDLNVCYLYMVEL